MQLTIDSKEPLDRVLHVVGSLYGVELTVAAPAADPAPASPARPATRVAAKPRGRARGATKSKTTASRSRRRPASPRGALDLSAVRRWARENGHPVAGRGRIPGSVLAAYQASTAS